MTEPIKEFGTIVNDRDGMDKSNDRTLSLDEAIIPVRLPHNLFDRLVKAAQFYGYPNVEAYCAAKMVESLNTKVGAAHISSPTQVSQVEAKKITGPSGSGMVTRG